MDDAKADFTGTNIWEDRNRERKAWNIFRALKAEAANRSASLEDTVLPIVRMLAAGEQEGEREKINGFLKTRYGINHASCLTWERVAEIMGELTTLSPEGDHTHLPYA